ncbi:MAG: hypothetical protein QXV17_07615 [Candidatus Micrarchaeaceae archaeon]
MTIDKELKLRQEIKNLLRMSISDLVITLDDFKSFGTLIDFDLYSNNIDIIIRRLETSVLKLKEYKGGDL